MRRLESVAFGLTALFVGAAGSAHADDLMGQPTPGAIDLQPGASILKHQAITFHNWILMPIITAIAVFVLALLLICIVRFNSKANPVPARWSQHKQSPVLRRGGRSPTLRSLSAVATAWFETHRLHRGGNSSDPY